MPEEQELPNGPLYGLRVVDVTDIRGALCGRLLADLGADVLRVAVCEEDLKDSWEHKFRNANKRRLGSNKTGLDITNKNDREELLEVLETADVLIENLGHKLLLEYNFLNLNKKFPNLVHISISDFGLSGPHSDWRLEPLPAFSTSGAHEVSGFPHMSPCWLPGFMAHDCASVFGAVGAVIAIMDRRRTDSGQMVEISVQEAALNGMNPWSLLYEDYLEKNPYLPAAGGRSADSAYWVLPAKDGWVRTVIGGVAHWKGFLEVIGKPEALSGSEWEILGFRVQNSDVIRLVSSPELSKKTKAELFEESQRAGTMIGPIHSLEEFINHPQIKHREFFIQTGWEGMEDVFVASTPWKLEKTPASLRLRAPMAKASGETNWLDEESKTFCPTNNLKVKNQNSKALLLEGIRVIEFGAAAVVPEMCWILTELGAEVIKLESRTHPDVLRISESVHLDARFAFNAECRGRKSVALDLASDKGREIAFDLCVGADVIAENFRGGVLEKMGLGYEALSTKNPELIYVSSQGYGIGGPMAKTPAFGPINSAFAGINALWNHSEEDLEGLYPCGTSLNHPDHIAGKMLALAVLSAIDYKNRTGSGQLIDMSQAEAGAYLMGEFYMEPGGRKANGNRSTHIVPHDVYEAISEKWISIVAKTDEEFANLVQVIGGDIGGDTIPPEWQNAKGRLEHREEIDAWISKWTKTQDPLEATKTLQYMGVSAMMVQGPRDHHNDAHLKERDYIVELNHPVVGMEHHTGNPLNMGKTKLETAGPSPCLGADTEEVLTRILKMTSDQVQELIANKTCW